MRHFISACSHTVNSWLTRAGILMAQGRQGSAEGVLRGLLAGLQGETGTPKRLGSPALGERLILAHPWRLCRLLGAIGRRMEISPSQT